MKIIKTAGNDLIVVEVPVDAYDFKWISNNPVNPFVGENTYFITYRMDKHIKKKKIKIEFPIKILGKLSELSEKDCSRFVELTNTGLYKKYIWDENKIRETAMQPLSKTAKESLINLLLSNGVDISKELLIIEVL